MGSVLTLLTIEIGMNPELRDFGGVLITWHGVFTAVGIAAGVFAAVVLGRRRGFIDDDAYSVALAAIPCGIIGARALFVAERWSTFEDNWLDIIRLDEGGISIYGMVIGGLVGGLVYGWFRKLPLRRALDVAAAGIMVGMGIGRVGDIINGEHFAETSSLPWAVRYTHLNSPSVTSHPQCGLGVSGDLDVHNLCAQHPAVAYEMIGDFLIVGIAVFFILRLANREGLAFFSFLLLYALMRFGVSELRLDSRDVIWGLTTPQVTSLFLIPVGLIGLVWSWRAAPSERPSAPVPVSKQPAGRPAG